MKLQEAIEILTNYNYSLLGVASSDICDAQNLLIEAGNRILHMRQTLTHVVQPLLKGEQRG